MEAIFHKSHKSIWLKRLLFVIAVIVTGCYCYSALMERGPSSASQSYGGSRRLEARFRYKSQNSRAAFVELAPEWRPTQEELYAWLEACPLVERVEWQSSKRSQGGHWEAPLRALHQGIPEATRRRLCHAKVPAIRGNASLPPTGKRIVSLHGECDLLASTKPLA